MLGPLPPGYSAPFSTITETDHSAWVIIATAVGLACVLIFTCARIVVRYSVTAGLGQDDYFLGAAVALAIIQSSIVLYGASIGLGGSMLQLTTHDQIRIEKVYYSSNLLWIVAVTLPKISIAAMLQRIDSFNRNSNVAFYAMAGFIGAWMIASFFALALQCNLSHPWLTFHVQHCTDVFVRWQAISAIDILTEILLLASAIYFLWAIQTSLSRKAIILTGFAFRLPIIIAIAFRLATYSRHGLTTDPSLREAEFIAWTQTELNYSIISATIPGLLQFMRNLNTQFGGLTEQENVTYGKSSGKGGSKSRSFPMSVLRSNRSNNASHNARHGMSQNDDGYEEGNGVYGAHGPPYGNRGTNNGQPPAMGVRKDNPSMGSTDSQRMIIQKSVSYDVNYE